MEQRDLIIGAVATLLCGVVAALTAAGIKLWNAYVSGYGKLRKVNVLTDKEGLSLLKSQQEWINQQHEDFIVQLRESARAEQQEMRQELIEIYQKLEKIDEEHRKCRDDSLVMKFELAALKKQNADQQTVMAEQQNEIAVLRKRVQELEAAL